MKTFSARHRIYLLYRQSQAEESMVSFIRDKLIRRGCSVVRDIKQSNTVLVLLTPGVFEFIDTPDDKVSNELIYILRRCKDHRVLGILCDLFVWPDSMYLPEEILGLKLCDAIEWSLENRDAFMTCLLERIDPSLLTIRSCPASPEIIYEEAAQIPNGGEGRNGVSTRARTKEGFDGGRRGSAFYFDDINQHVEQKTKGAHEDRGGPVNTSDGNDFEESSGMELYQPPELPDSNHTSPLPSGAVPAYKPPQISRDGSLSNGESNSQKEAPEISSTTGAETEGDVMLRRNQNVDYSPELPLDIEDAKKGTQSPSVRTATIRPTSGDKVSIYVPPPTPPCLERNEIGKDEFDTGEDDEITGHAPSQGITTTVEVEQIPSPRSAGDPAPVDARAGDEATQHVARRRLRAQPMPRPASAPERSIDGDLIYPDQQRRFTQPYGRGSPNSASGARVERKSTIGKFLHRRTFTLPKDSEIRHGRYADEHPYGNNGTYRKYNLDDEFCDESYFAIRRFTLPRISVRASRRNSSRRQSRNVPHDVGPKSGRSTSVVVLNETEIHRFVPEIEPTSDEPPDESEARRRDAGSTPKGERKTYESVEEYRPPAEPRINCESAKGIDDEAPSHVESRGNGARAEPCDAREPRSETVEEYRPPPVPQTVEEPLVGMKSPPRGSAPRGYSPPEEPEPEEFASPDSAWRPEIPKSSPPAFDSDVLEFVVLPAPRKHIMVDYAQSKEDSFPAEQIEPLPDQGMYVQQCIPPRRIRALSEPSDVGTHVPDVRTAARWNQVQVEDVSRHSLQVRAGSRDPRSRPTSGKSEDKYRPPSEPAAADNRSWVKELGSQRDTGTKFEPRANGEPPIAAERKLKPTMRREPHADDVQHRFEPLAGRVSDMDEENKADPTLNIETASRTDQTSSPVRDLQAVFRKPSLPRDNSVATTKRGDASTARRGEPLVFKEGSVVTRSMESGEVPIVVTRRIKPIPRAFPPLLSGVIGGTSLSRQFTEENSSTDQKIPVERTQLVTPPASGRPMHSGGDGGPSPFGPSKSRETEARDHESTSRGKLPFESSTPAGSIHVEYAKSLLIPDETYQAPPTPIAPIPRQRNRVVRESSEVRRDAERSLPHQSVQAANYPPPPQFDDEIGLINKIQSPRVHRGEHEPLPAPQTASRSSQLTYVPPELPIADVESDKRKATSAHNQNLSNDGDDEDDGDDGTTGTWDRENRRRPASDSHKQLSRDKPIVDDHVQGDRRTKSVIEYSHSKMDPVLRGRTYSLDPRLTRDLREYVERHICDGNCCKVVCPRRLASNIDNVHFADDARVLTNLDVLGRRRLSYLLAVEAQRYVSYIDSQFISAAGGYEGSKTPDSGCDPNSKVSELDSDAAISDGEFVSEKKVAQELAKIEKIRRRNARLSGIIPPPNAYGTADRHQVYWSSEPESDRGEGTQNAYRVPSSPSEQRVRSQNEYEPPQLPANDDYSRSNGAAHMGPDRIRSAHEVDTYSPPELPAEDELSNGIPSNLAAREAMKNIIEGKTVFRPQNPERTAVQDQRDKDARDAHDLWHSIWRGADPSEIPALSGQQILTLFGVMRHILGTKSRLKEVRDDLLTIIKKNGMGSRR
ncbi:uncharacterized protein LOC114828120 [Galendromus occidentalis]|uniref:Uncharacterized protein LOC114828120 n=1 Tax=Galendromus occidentalis TaxID=34638 RepID=A0AAJ7SFG9_9ACAR|nr:uncharacterized protein LOC114828120 [Galendromus occidentalis]